MTFAICDLRFAIGKTRGRIALKSQIANWKLEIQTWMETRNG